ncbi:hypothetical protein KUCAC02_023233, partial [Chaenocephalus aceratus]
TRLVAAVNLHVEGCIPIYSMVCTGSVLAQECLMRALAGEQRGEDRRPPID